MDNLQASVVRSLDGGNDELFPFLPYLLQDITELGASPFEAGALILKCGLNCRRDLSVLDLGCGKGAVSIALCETFGWRVTGIDAVPEFINEANLRVINSNLQNDCRFIVADIRNDSDIFYHHDIIILGAIGPVLGDLDTTLQTIARYLNPQGYVLIDDGYIPDDSSYVNPVYLKQNLVLKSITNNGFEVIDQAIIAGDTMADMNNDIYQKIENRANELIT